VPQAARRSDNFRLHVHEVEKTFVQVAIDLKQILVLDGIDQLADPPRFRIRSHDLYGPLPDIIVEDTGDRYPVLEGIEREAAKLTAMVRVRKELSSMFPGCEFLLPIKTDKGVLVGLRLDGRTVLAEDKSYWEAYHKLHRKAVMALI
jgi:hypothetical protein